MTELENGAVAEEEAAERKPTERVILERVSVLVIPDGTDPEKLGEAIRALTPARGKRAVNQAHEAWVEVSRQTAASKTAAIELYAGKAGTADAKVGVWRAPTVTAWKQAIVYEAPPVPLIERTVID